MIAKEVIMPKLYDCKYSTPKIKGRFLPAFYHLWQIFRMLFFNNFYRFFFSFSFLMGFTFIVGSGTSMDGHGIYDTEQ